MVKEAIAITENDLVADIIIRHYLRQKSQSITIQKVDQDQKEWWFILLSDNEFKMINGQPFQVNSSPYRNYITIITTPDNSRKVIT